MARLGDICKFQSGGTPSKSNPDFFGGNIPWITTVALNGGIINSTNAVEWITDKAIQESAAKIVPQDSIMIGTRVGIGKVAINSGPMSTSQDVISLLDIDTASWDKAFLCKFIIAKNDFLLSQARGATIKGIKIDTLSNLQVPDISLEEQRRIATLLDKVSDLIAKRRAQLDKLDLLVKAKFVEMFGDPVKNPHGYPVHQLADYIEFLTSGSRGWAQYFSDEGEYFITIKNVKNCRITLCNVQHIVPPDNAEAKRTKVQEGDLLISITADLGRTGVVTKEIADHGAYINQHLTCIRLNQKAVLPLYAAYYMESDAGKGQFQAKNQSAVKAGLNFNSISTLRLLVPPMELQNHFITYVKQANKTKLTIQQSLEKMETLKKALLQEFFDKEM